MGVARVVCVCVCSRCTMLIPSQLMGGLCAWRWVRWAGMWSLLQCLSMTAGIRGVGRWEWGEGGGRVQPPQPRGPVSA
jgi:hypothetical protein